MLQRTLLIIDDDVFWLKLITKFFTLHKYKVYQATTCAEGINMAQLYKPACILLDFWLPDADGCKVAFYVRAKAELSRTPIIMITNDDQQELRAQMEYGVDILLPKITSFAKILVTVDSLLRRVGWEREIITKGDLSLNGTRSEVLRNSRPVATLSSEQFKLFFLLVERSPEFVTEEDISKCVYASDSALEKIDAINMLAYRLRQALGPQLARRIKNKRSRGWIYIPPQYSTQIAPVLSEKVQES